VGSFTHPRTIVCAHHIAASHTFEDVAEDHSAAVCRAYDDRVVILRTKTVQAINIYALINIP
jgi:hypothetical protein